MRKRNKNSIRDAVEETGKETGKPYFFLQTIMAVVNFRYYIECLFVCFLDLRFKISPYAHVKPVTFFFSIKLHIINLQCYIRQTIRTTLALNLTNYHLKFVRLINHLFLMLHFHAPQ